MTRILILIACLTLTSCQYEKAEDYSNSAFLEVIDDWQQLSRRGMVRACVVRHKRTGKVYMIVDGNGTAIQGLNLTDIP